MSRKHCDGANDRDSSSAANTTRSTLPSRLSSVSYDYDQIQYNSPGTKCFHRLSPYQSEKSNSVKGSSRKGRANDNSYTTMPNTTFVSFLLEMSMQFSLLLTSLSDLLLDPQGNKHPLVQNGKLMSTAWKVTGSRLRWKEVQAIS